MHEVMEKARLLWLATGASVLALASCSGGDSIDGGGSQSADPATVDFPIFYVKRPVPDASDDVRQMRDFAPGAALYMRSRAAPSGVETNITARIAGSDSYDVKDVDVSADGRRILFAMRGPLRQNMSEEDAPTWNLWQYEIASDTLRRVMASDLVAEEGHDVAPHFLPDGRIVFSSTRQRASKAILLDEGKPQFEALNEDRSEPAFVLHVMNADGSDIRQISFNPSHDRDPIVLSDGRLLWSRWDRSPGRNAIHFYTAHPDGTNLRLHYGANSHETGTNGQTIQFVKAREMPDGRLLALLRPFRDADFGGDLVLIDASTYVENTQATLASQGMNGPAQVRATPNDVRTIPGPSPGGRFNSAFPLWDGTNRILVSWSQCRLRETGTTSARIVPCTDSALAAPDATAAPPLYSVWMFDPRQNTFLPILTPTEGVMITDVVAAQPRALPRVILDRVPGPGLESDLVGEGTGILHIRSVYDIRGTDTAQPNLAALADHRLTRADQRPARFLRIEKPVAIPDDDVRDLAGAAFGISPFMREIIGYAPVEPDGSVRVKVPANVAFQISVLDRNGRRISAPHRSWLQVRPGETLECNGCHAPRSQNPVSHGRDNLFPALNTGAAATGVPFPGTDPALSPDAGETMAQTRTRTRCTTPGCPALDPHLDVVYEDVWTHPATANREKDASFAYRHADLATPAPRPQDCADRWSASCRIVINYPQHIHPLWGVARAGIDPNTGQSDPDYYTCARAGCHNPVAANNTVQVPAGQLDLTEGASDDEPLHLKSYRELLFTDAEQEVNMGALQDRVVPGPMDPATGQPTQVTVSVGPYVSAGNARGSTRFFDRFESDSEDFHAGILTPAELRLLSEWLDIGAQYFNNPFDPAAPAN